MGILTKWHKLRDAAASGTLCLATDGKNAIGDDDLTESLLDRERLKSLLDGMDALPRFVVPPDLMRMMLTDQAMMSVTDMEHCGVLGLPFPECVVEFDSGDTRFSVLLQDESDEERRATGMRWVAVPVASYEDGGEEVAMAFPAVLQFGVVLPERPAEGEAPPGQASFRYVVTLPAYTGADKERMQGYAAETAPLVFQRCAVAFAAAVLLSNTLGLERERVSVPALNRSRRARGRAPVPDHTVIRLATYRPSEDAEPRAWDAAAPVEVFLRRAHKRRVAVGQGRTGRRWHFFPAQVVGYLPDGRKPTVPEMLATRAAKPYLVRP